VPLKLWETPEALFAPLTADSSVYCDVFYGDAAETHKNPPVPITHPAPKRSHWLFSADPHNYHWDTLFVKGKEMWRGAGSRADALRALKLVRQGDRVLCYHAAPERALYALAEVTRDPYPDPHAPESKAMVADLRALERLPRQVSLAELRENRSLRKVKFLKNVRLIISPVTDTEYQEILRMAGIVASPGLPLP
jgi:predicted RNA-binding protein with PUA-like domain